MMPGPYRCGCNASYGQSCGECDGTYEDQREAARMRRRRLQARPTTEAKGWPAVYARNEGAA